MGGDGRRGIAIRIGDSRDEQQEYLDDSILSICLPDWSKYEIRAHSRVSPVVLSFGNSPCSLRLPLPNPAVRPRL